MAERIGILVMAYGTPASLADVEAYYTHIRHGRPPTPELLQELVGRYEAIGGLSPLIRITAAQANALEESLRSRPPGGLLPEVRVGFKHCSPFIGDAATRMVQDGFERVVGVVLAPHYSALSVGAYIREAREAASRLGYGGRMEFVESWHLQPPLITALAQRVRGALARFAESEKDDVRVIFSAHSLPERILADGDPYPEQLLAASRATAEEAGVSGWSFAWQSAGRTSESWLGPDILRVIEQIAAEGGRSVLVCPIGFVADHLEVLYDLDIEAKAFAGERGVRLERTESLNSDPLLVEALDRAVREAAARLF